MADIGTDHARLPIYLVLQGISSQVIASDLSTGPLSTARFNVYLYKLEKNRIRQGYGLEPLDPGEADVIIVAGMGGAKIEIFWKNHRGAGWCGSHDFTAPSRSGYCAEMVI